MKPSKKLEELAVIALRAEIATKKAAAMYEEAKLNFLAQAEDEGMLNQDTKAIGPVRTKITPNRYFDHDTAITLLPEDVILECTVEVVDDKLLKQHMNAIQIEKAMKTYPKPWKVGFSVAEM